MNAHQRLVFNQIKGLTPEKVATAVAEPPGHRAKGADVLNLKEVHKDILTYADQVDEILDAWADLLADAAGVEAKDGWPALWTRELAELMKDLPVRVAVPVASLDDVRQAA